MITANLSQLKKELAERSQDQILSICLRLARHKKENKELLHYLLLESHNESGYIEAIKSEITEGFETINQSNLYYAKKGIRRVLRLVTKHIRYSGNKQTEVEVLSFFCKNLIELDIPIQESKVLLNLLNNQIKKIEQALSTLHEDLQYDYNQDLEYLKKYQE